MKRRDDLATFAKTLPAPDTSGIPASVTRNGCSPRDPCRDTRKVSLRHRWPQRQEKPCCAKICMRLQGFMRPDICLMIVESADSAKAEVADVIAEISEDDPTCSRRGNRFQSDAAAT
jgi:hypothetical protein